DIGARVTRLHEFFYSPFFMRAEGGPISGDKMRGILDYFDAKAYFSQFEQMLTKRKTRILQKKPCNLLSVML
ncbi:MAG: hypothetical protein MJ141_03770, partial [Clostridia bacterium]|nr:hypothetical protein [Clostridia bacterium]